FVAGTGGTASGLAYRSLEAGYTLAIPRMFAALALLAGSGVLLYAVLSGVSYLALRRWHESAVGREGGLQEE
ncbi:MAG TPA: ABC transporter permease, partial [Thermoanaerobaculia bacterium]|nr:ABC transporter permease [Thermoanaerobaculia bacterium]